MQFDPIFKDDHHTFFFHFSFFLFLVNFCQKGKSFLAKIGQQFSHYFWPNPDFKTYFSSFFLMISKSCEGYFVCFFFVFPPKHVFHFGFDSFLTCLHVFWLIRSCLFVFLHFWLFRLYFYEKFLLLPSRGWFVCHEPWVPG